MGELDSFLLFGPNRCVRSSLRALVSQSRLTRRWNRPLKSAAAQRQSIIQTLTALASEGILNLTDPEVAIVWCAAFASVTWTHSRHTTQMELAGLGVIQPGARPFRPWVLIRVEDVDPKGASCGEKQ